MEQKLISNELISDKVGFETLDNIAQADRFNKWMFSVVSSDFKGKILEIGSGIGNISAYCIENGYDFTASDLRIEYCDYLKNKFDSYENFNGVYQIDIADKDFDKKYAEILGKFDTVFALNIIEHVADDDLAIKNCFKLLKTGGTLVILVPAFMFLYNSFDRGLEHYRRYNRKNLNALFLQNNFKIHQSRYFNFAGALGWWFSGSILKKKAIPSGQMRIYNSLVWIFKIVDFFTKSCIGLSVITSGKK